MTDKPRVIRRFEVERELERATRDWDECNEIHRRVVDQHNEMRFRRNAAILSAIKSGTMTEAEIASMARVHRSTVYRIADEHRDTVRMIDEQRAQEKADQQRRESAKARIEKRKQMYKGLEGVREGSEHDSKEEK